MDAELIRKIPKAELHCHLDGSISPRTLRRMAGGRKLEEDKLQAPVPCHSLRQYLECFSVVLPLMQTEENLSLSAWDVIRQAGEENVRYMEVRFAPAFHRNGGLDKNQVCRAVLKGLEQGEKEFGVKSRLLLCLMRGNSARENLETVECARELRDFGVAGLDLAGDEAGYPTEIYREFFEKAVHYDIPFTIHSGECGSAENVERAVEMGARRIGHGVAAAHQEALKVLCREKNICFEMCPISNLQTKAVENLKDYPFLPMTDQGLQITVNTDNRTVSGTTLTKEWMTLAAQFPQINEEMIRSANLTAVQAAFLPDWEKKNLIREMKEMNENTMK